MFQAQAWEPAQTYSRAHFIIACGSAFISLLVKQGQSWENWEWFIRYLENKTGKLAVVFYNTIKASKGAFHTDSSSSLKAPTKSSEKRHMNTTQNWATQLQIYTPLLERELGRVGIYFQF